MLPKLLSQHEFTPVAVQSVQVMSDTTTMGTTEKRSLRFKILICFLIDTCIAIGFMLFARSPFLPAMVYSQCIGFSIFGLSALGSHLFVKDENTHSKREYMVVPFAVAGGVVLGYGMGDVLLGHNLLRTMVGSPSQFAGNLLFSLIIAIGLTYFFINRERLSRAREELARSQATTEAAQRHAAEAQLKLLETQLEPHMLFNTLANLRILIGTDAARAQDMLDHLIAYLRATLSASRAASHSLEQEFARLEDYLALMAVRMGPRLSYTLDLPVDLRAQTVPPLLLQALVENSIKHGLEPKIAGGSIHISAARSAGMLRLTVADTGVGLTAEPAKSLDAKTPDGGFGLAQVRERLAAAYGNLGAMELIAGRREGIEASITFPLESTMKAEATP